MPHLLTKNKITPFAGSKLFTNSYRIDNHSKYVHFQFALTLRSIDEISSVNKAEIQNIKEFRKLKANWDSYEAMPVSEKSIDSSISFVKEINNYDKDVYLTSPGPNGEVLVQLNQGNKEIEFLFYPDKSVYLLFQNNDFIKQAEYDKTVLQELIEWLDIDE